MTSRKQNTRRIHAAPDGALRDGVNELPGASFDELIDITREGQGAFGVAVVNAAPGVKILYHVGEFCAGPHKKDARAAYDVGHVTLTIRKRDRFLFEYLAVALDPKKPRSKW